jgi:hypothetical protein
MLTAIVMSDAVSRHIVPDVYPPVDTAAEQYVRAFLRLLGVPATGSAAPAPSTSAPR